MSPELIQQIAIWALPVLLAITLHEAAHGFAALRLGDDTAHRLGRVTLNPLKHIDPFGTIIMPGLLLLSGAPFLFGYAKPVPVNFRRLRDPKRDMVLVAAAGPGMNLALALASVILLRLWLETTAMGEGWVSGTLQASLLLNLVLAVFNMIPLPPLDGGRVAVGLLPRPLAIPLARLERWGMFIILGLLIVPALSQQLGLRIDILGWLLYAPVRFLRETLISLVFMW
jgi:Zn-dependent protease